MVWEFPAVSQSRIEFWNKPQFTQSGMWWFTLAFGFIGLHHLYLRSPQTAIMFLIGNIFSLGYLWAYDMVQLSSSGGYTTETLNKHGLAHPWGALGLAQGMWIGSGPYPPPSPSPSPYPTAASGPSAPSAPPSAKNFTPLEPTETTQLYPQEKGMSGPITWHGGARKEDDGPPNPLWFFFYALLIPIAPLAQIIAGDTNNAVSRFADLTIIPLGFLFYLCAMLYDYWILFSNPADLLVAGSKRFFPFTYLGMDADGHSPMLTGKSEIKPCPPDSVFKTVIRMLLPIVTYFFPGLGKSISAALMMKDEAIMTAITVKEEIVDKGMAKVGQVADTAAKIGSLSSSLTKGFSGSVGKASSLIKIPEIISNPEFVSKIGSLAPMPSAPTPIIEVTGSGTPVGNPPPPGMVASTNGQTQFKNPTTGQGYGTMVGGARSARSEKSKENTFNTLDYTALGALGAVIGGGLLLSASRNVGSKNDTPPNTRAV